MKYIILPLWLLICYSLLNCKKQNQELIAQEKILIQPKRDWLHMPQYKVEGIIEVMEGRTEENQKLLESIYDLTLGLPEGQEFIEEDYRMEEINLMNHLYYLGLKSFGFQFPSEQIFAQRIMKIFNVDIYADYSNNSKIKKIDNFLILSPKVYMQDKYDKAPLLYFTYGNYIFDLEHRYFFSFSPGYVEKHLDDYDKEYYAYNVNSYDLAYNNYIFHNSRAALIQVYDFLPYEFVKDFGYEGFSQEYHDIYQRIQTKYMEEYKKMSELSREGWDYRMYDRLFFSRGLDGKLIVKKKMLAAAVELAKEDEAYIRVPLNYYFIQMTTKYIPNEYAADYSEVHNYLTEREPFYTPEERAMIWVYTSLLELHLPPSETKISPYTFIGIALNYPELYEVAEAHDFFGEDMSEVIEQIDRMTINSPL
ncbi:hypothetical protein [Myroides odoratus]|uniref:hypothetical protein n=1 Tax=Myroides odoratus TaxID=256 RepID=UPI00333F7858